MVKATPGTSQKGRPRIPSLLHWTMLAYDEALAVARVADKCFTESGAANEHIQGIVSAWGKHNDDVSVLLILESYVKTIQKGKAAPMSAAAIQIVAACFALTNAQDMNDNDFQAGSEKYFLLRRFGAVIERAKLLSEIGEGGSAAPSHTVSPPSQADAEKIEAEVLRQLRLARSAQTAEASKASHAGRAAMQARAGELFLAASDPWESLSAAAEAIVPEILKMNVSRPLAKGNAQRTVTGWLRALVKSDELALGKLTAAARARLKSV